MWIFLVNISPSEEEPMDEVTYQSPVVWILYNQV